jgi:hypothetical protein
MAASPTERSWCVLEFARFSSFVAVQRAIRWQFGSRGNYVKLQTFLFRIVVTLCIFVQYLQNTPIIYTHPVFSQK